MGACGTDEGCERGHKADEECPQGHQAGVETARVELQEGEKDDQSDEGIEVDTVNMRSILNDIFEIEMASLKVREIPNDNNGTMLIVRDFVLLYFCATEHYKFIVIIIITVTKQFAYSTVQMTVRRKNNYKNQNASAFLGQELRTHKKRRQINVLPFLFSALLQTFKNW